MNSKNDNLAIVLSYKNEKNNIIELIDRVAKTLIRIRKEMGADGLIILIDDDSTDDSYKLIKKYREENKREIPIHYYRTSRNFGNSECLVYVVKEVLNSGKFINITHFVFLDCDLQDPPELILEMYEKISKNSLDIVGTIRTKRLGESKFKLIVTYLGYRLMKFVSNIDHPIDSGDFIIFNARIAKELSKNNDYKPYLRGIIHNLGFKKDAIYYTRQPRADGSENTKFPLTSFKVWWSYFDRTLIAFSDFPLKVMAVFGLFLFIVSLFFIALFSYKFLTNNYVSGLFGITTILLFILSTVLLSSSVLGLYICNIYNQIKNRDSVIIAIEDKL
jgi:glycosyltransferase involved in cell wall biosynthesis